MKQYPICILTIFLGVVATTSAQHGSLQRLTLKDAVITSLDRNHDLIAARHEVDKADARVSEAIGYALPRIDFTATYTRAIKKPVFFFPNVFASDSTQRSGVSAIEIGSDNSIDMNLTAVQPLFNSTILTGVGTSRIYARAAREAYSAKELETVTNVRKAFYGVLVARSVHGLYEENLKNAEENHRNVRILSEQGILSEYDQLRSEVVVENVRPEVTNAQRNYSLAINNLKMTVGIPFETEIVVDGELKFERIDDEIVRSASGTLSEKNSMLAASRLQSEVSEGLISVERSNYIPTLSAFANYQYQAQKNDFKFRASEFVGSALVGVTLSVNIFSGWQTNAKVEHAQLEFRQSQERVATIESGLKSTLESTILQLRRSEQLVAAQERTVGIAERGYRIASARLATGSATQVEVNDAQLALTRSKVNRIQAIYDYLVASADLDNLLGRLPSFVNSN